MDQRADGRTLPDKRERAKVLRQEGGNVSEEMKGNQCDPCLASEESGMGWVAVLGGGKKGSGQPSKTTGSHGRISSRQVTGSATRRKG